MELLTTCKDMLVSISIVTNILFSIAIIQLNKYIFVEYDFPDITLTCIHFIITFVGLVVCNKYGMFKKVEIPLGKMLPMAISFCGFVVLANLSLHINTVGTYQCLKIMTIPGVMLISYYLNKHTFSMRVKLSIVSERSNRTRNHI